LALLTPLQESCGAAGEKASGGSFFAIPKTLAISSFPAVISYPKSGHAASELIAASPVEEE
jgi:hypothetical protein